MFIFNIYFLFCLCPNVNFSSNVSKCIFLAATSSNDAENLTLYEVNRKYILNEVCNSTHIRDF